MRHVMPAWPVASCLRAVFSELAVTCANTLEEVRRSLIRQTRPVEHPAATRELSCGDASRCVAVARRRVRQPSGKA